MTTGKKKIIGTVTVENPDGTRYLYAYIVKEELTMEDYQDWWNEPFETTADSWSWEDRNYQRIYPAEEE